MLVVEPVRGEDVQDVAKLAQDTLRERYGTDWVLEHFERHRPTFLVARDVPSNRVVGFAVADEDEAKGAEILALAVDRMRQGQGIGRALLRSVEDSLARRGAHQIELDVRADDPAALVFYQRHGFWPEGLRSQVYADGGDAIHMLRPVQ